VFFMSCEQGPDTTCRGLGKGGACVEAMGVGLNRRGAGWVSRRAVGLQKSWTGAKRNVERDLGGQGVEALGLGSLDMGPVGPVEG
jgi:hypothetical protein